MPDPVAHETAGPVRRIMPERKRMASNILHDLSARDSQERPHDRHPSCPILGSRGRHSSQARGPCAPQKIHEDGFGLIIGGVRGDDRGAPASPRHLGKRLISKIPCRFLKTQTMVPGKSPHIDGLNAAGDVPFPGQSFNKPYILCGTLTEAVVDVTDDKPIGLAAEKMRKRHGIRPPRNGRQ